MYTAWHEESKAKAEARAWITDAYRECSGQKTLPSDRAFWALCFSAEEIIQLETSGLIRPEQFHGINRDEAVVKALQKKCPSAAFLQGEWRFQIQKIAVPPACVYLDSTQEIENPNLHIDLGATMRVCPPNTLLAVNVILKNAWRNNTVLSEDILRKFMSERFSGEYISTWDLKAGAYEYRSGSSLMKTFLFWRGLPLVAQA